jgi:hypothetical protein
MTSGNDDDRGVNAQTDREERAAASDENTGEPATKKEQILSLFTSGMRQVEDLAVITNARPSYVANVLREAGLQEGYFDLYTSTSHEMNVYSKFFADQLGFRDVETARESVDLIDQMYERFAVGGDRAGQHHALLMALTMFNRARWTEKIAEADVFRRWLLERLAEDTPPVPDEG